MSISTDTSIPQKIIRPAWWNPNFGSPVGCRQQNILCSDGKRRTAVFAAEPDTFFTIPASVRVNGKSVSGFVWHDDLIYDDDYQTTPGVWKFTAYSYGKNGHLLPEWDKK